jgi:hypothetical protein
MAFCNSINCAKPKKLYKLVSLLEISLAANTPDADAWISPLLTPAPSPTAKRFSISVSRDSVSFGYLE